MSLARRAWLPLVLFGVLIAASRYPLAPGQLFTFDDVNLAYSIGHYDIRISQPHPPGYPLFVAEMRALWRLRFRNVEHLLLALAVAGSVAALVLLALAGNRILGGRSGWFAAWLMLLHPVFWHAGVTSALRVQLAVVSLAVAAACWRAWSGNGRWVLGSAVILGIGAGIRPELGPLLFPLWAACACRAPVSWRQRSIALACMCAAVLVWLLPAMLASGGPAAFVKACFDYISDQASVSSGLFGATENKWRATFWRTFAWICCGLLGFAAPAVLAWRPKEGWGLGRDRLAFLALWFVPPFLFALLVHIEDPGHTLAMLPAVCLFGGYLVDRAVAAADPVMSRWRVFGFAAVTVAVAWYADRHNQPLWAMYALFAGFLMGRGKLSRPITLAIAAAAAAITWVVDNRDARDAVVWIPLFCLSAALVVRFSSPTGLPQRWQLAVLLLCPALLINDTLFRLGGWYYRGTHTSGVRGAAEQALADLNTGLALTSYAHIKSTLDIDDHTIREVERLAAERPGRTVVIWERGLTAWRKAAYYAPSLPIIVLEHRKIRAGSPPDIAVWKGSHLEQHWQGAAPLTAPLPAGARVVWLLNPATDFFRAAQHAFPLTPAGPVWYTDLPG